MANIIWSSPPSRLQRTIRWKQNRRRTRLRSPPPQGRNPSPKSRTSGKKFPSITITPASPPPPKATSPQPLPTITHAWKKDIPINHDHAHAPRRLNATGRDAAGCATASKLAENTARPALPSGQVLSMSKARSGASSIPT